MMNWLAPREMVILAEDFESLVAWYRNVLGFSVTRLFDDGYHYCNLQTATGIKIGIASAAEMGVEPRDRKQNTVIIQFEVENVATFFAHLEKAGGVVTFGPSFDERDRFWYGGFSDPEGNPFWVVDQNCP